MNESSGVVMVPMVLMFLVLAVFMLASMWKVFTKAGEPGWLILIPIFNLHIMLKIAGKPSWWLLLMLIPIVSIIISLLMVVGIANNFGKGVGFGLGLLFLPFVFYPILAFGSAEYEG